MTGQNKAGFYGLALAVAVLAGVLLVRGGMAGNKSTSSVPPVTADWTAPTTGTPIEKYEVEVENTVVDDPQFDPEEGPFYTTDATPTYTILAPMSVGSYRIRVRGIDASNRTGPWSLWSELKDIELTSPSFK